MLIQFSVENFRVFEKRQTFSMVADSTMDREFPQLVSDTGFAAAPKAHHQACILGPNGAGKTSLVEAIAFMIRFIRGSFSAEPCDLIETEQFAFSRNCQSEPSVFEIVFIDDDILCEYGFAVTPELVQEEWLTVQPKDEGEHSVVFTRDYDTTKPDNYEWYINPKYPDLEQNVWKKSNRPNALFLSTAVRFNLKVLIKVYDWMTKNIVFLNLSSNFRLRQQTARLLTDEKWKEKILHYFFKLDIELETITIEEVAHSESSMFGSLPEAMKEKYRKDQIDKKMYEIYLVRKDDHKKPVSFTLEEESTGIRAMFDIAGQLLPAIEQGLTVFVDEINSGLNPLVFQKILTLFDNFEHGHSSAQIIFTTHDVTIPGNESIDKDQVWFINRENNHSSNIYSYSECNDTSKVPFHRIFLRGKFGGIPLIS